MRLKAKLHSRLNMFSAENLGPDFLQKGIIVWGMHEICICRLFHLEWEQGVMVK